MSSQHSKRGSNDRDYSHVIAKGAVINALGIIGKLLFPVYFAIVARLFGPDTMGVFYIGFVVLEVAGNLTVAGVNDGIVMFGARYAGNDSHRSALYRILANGFVITGAIAAVVVITGQVIGPDLVRDHYTEYDAADALRIMLYALPFTVVSTVVIAATRSLLMMQWEALITNFLRPAALLGFSLAYYIAGDTSVTALASSYVWASIAACVASLLVFARYFSYRDLLSHIVRFSPSGQLIKFAIPQNLNMTFNHFITNVDVMMLGFFKVEPALVAFYGMGAQIVANIRQIQLAYSSILAPVIPRLHMARDVNGISEQLAVASRWAVSVALPAGIALVFFRQELVQLFHTSFTGDTTFMILLAIRPVLSCALGMTGNVIVMTGHSWVNLTNSCVVASMNIALNYLWIPLYGLTGAALATMVSSLTVTFLQVVEMPIFVGAKVLPSRLYKPFVAAAPAIGIALVAADPANGAVTRAMWCIGALACYAALTWTLGLDVKDRQVLRRLFRRRRPTS